MDAEKTLSYAINHLLINLYELSDISDCPSQAFDFGQKTAFVECLEMLQLWEKAKDGILNFDIEEKFPIN